MNKIFWIIIAIAMHFWFLDISANIKPNLLISSNKPAYSSSGSASQLVDNVFGSPSFTISDNSWIAINIGPGYSRVFLVWNDPIYTWSDVVAAATSCKQGMSLPGNYYIQTSSNSTNGEDGDWETKVTVTGNDVSVRGNFVDFEGATWIRMYILSGGGNLDEVQVFDMSDGGNDTWFFPGTSITANAFKASVPDKNFASVVAENYPGFTPAVIRGGIPCMNSTSMAEDIDLYIEKAGNAQYWAIEMGTNDAWGGSDYNAATFRTNMQTVITKCKENGIEPIIARMIGTNEEAAGWQVNEAYLTAIDELTEENELIEGPDFFTYFSTHPDELNSDGVHPNDLGAASIQRMWAENMVSLYTDSTVAATGIEVTPSELSISEGDKAKLLAVVYPLNAEDRSVIWSSENENIAVVSSDGLLTALAIGSVAIVGSTANGQFSDTCFVTVVEDTVIEEYTLEVSVSGRGTVTISPDLDVYTEDTEVTLTAIPDEGSEFIGWEGDVEGTGTVYTLIMDDNKTITASFTDYYSTCESDLTVYLPFSQDGAGTFCWKTTDDISIINSWNMEMVEINGVNYTNKWSNSFPAKEDGYYYIYYRGNYAWSHLELSGTKSSGSLSQNRQDVLIYPNPSGEQIHIKINNPERIKELSIIDLLGKSVYSFPEAEIKEQIKFSGLLGPGTYFLRIATDNSIRIYKIIRK